ncbi:hypothetical protein TNCT_447821, partial [Trichonephila clavata]
MEMERRILNCYVPELG